MKFVFTKPIKITAIVTLALLLVGGATTGIVLGLKDVKDEEEPGPEPTPEPDPIQITETMFTAPQALPNLHYNLDSQELISAGQTEYGTFMYKLGEAEYSPELPSVAITEDMYYVEFYIKGNEGNEDLGSPNIPVGIMTFFQF